jgi:hypothetical protein
VRVLHKTLHEAVHVHDPIEPHEADCLFAFAATGLTDQMLLPVFTCGQQALEAGELSFQRDTQPVAPSSDRHASKLVRKRTKRKQSYAAAMKTSIYGSYAPSRASSHTESRFGGSRYGGSRASVSVRGAAGAKIPKMSLIYGGGESLVNSSWIGSQQGSDASTHNYASWLQGGAPSSTSPSPPSSITGTARVAVDVVERQRRADIERDLSTRDSVRRSQDELHRKNDLRLKLRSLADPAVSLEQEELMLAALGAKGQRTRLQQSRQGTRGKTPGAQQAAVSPLDSKRISAKAPVLPDETPPFRTEDYEGLASDVVLFTKGGELLVGENCFVVEQRRRQELLLDLQTRGVVQPRIQLAATPKPGDDSTSSEASPTSPNTAQQQVRSSPQPLRPRDASFPPKQGPFTGSSAFGDQLGSFESSPCLALDFEAASLVKGVVLKLPEPVAQAPQTRLTVPRKTLKKVSLPESIPNAKLERQLSALIGAPAATKSALATSQSDPALQTQHTLSGVKSSQASRRTGAESPVLPKHLVSTAATRMARHWQHAP